MKRRDFITLLGGAWHRQAKVYQIILLALGLVLLALGTGANFASWASGQEPSAWHWWVPLGTLACGFGLLVTALRNAKWDKPD
jgi:hypothetical protein